MNPTTPKAHRIMLGAVIQHPCWLRFKHNQQWNRFERPPDPFSLPLAMFDEWHPDQPTAPTSIPSPVSSQDSEGTKNMGHLSPDEAEKMVDQMWTAPNQPVQEGLRTILGSLSRAQHFIRAGDSSKAKWNVMDAKLRIERLISSGEPEARPKPAPSPGASGEVREALELAMSLAFAGMHGVADSEIERWADDPSLSREMRQDAIDCLKCRKALSKPAAPMLPGGTLVDGKDGERIDLLESLNGVTICRWDGGKKISVGCKHVEELEGAPWHSSLRSALDDLIERRKQTNQK